MADRARTRRRRRWFLLALSVCTVLLDRGDLDRRRRPGPGATRNGDADGGEPAPELSPASGQGHGGHEDGHGDEAERARVVHRSHARVNWPTPTRRSTRRSRLPSCWASTSAPSRRAWEASRARSAPSTGGDNAKAANDISVVSDACTELAGGTKSGLVYPFDFPDPDVILVGQTYYAYATNSVAGNIQIIDSTDLEHWTAVGNALPHLPSWAIKGSTWAPSVTQIGGQYDLYYAVDPMASATECISVATAASPQGPFTDTSSDASRVPAVARGLHRSVSLRRPERRHALSPLEVGRSRLISPLGAAVGPFGEFLQRRARPRPTSFRPIRAGKQEPSRPLTWSP